MALDQYLGNNSVTKMEVHDRYNKQPRCNLSLIKEEHKVYFSTLDAATDAGFDPCGHCLEGSTR